jgi:hypothetical protein
MVSKDATSRPLIDEFRKRNAARFILAAVV